MNALRKQFETAIDNGDDDTVRVTLESASKRNRAQLETPEFVIRAINNLEYECVNRFVDWQPDPRFWLIEEIWIAALKTDDTQMCAIIKDAAGGKHPKYLDGQPFVHYVLDLCVHPNIHEVLEV